MSIRLSNICANFRVNFSLSYISLISLEAIGNMLASAFCKIVCIVFTN